MDRPPLSPGGATIHVWAIALDDVGRPPPAIELLDASERARMDALRSERQRAAFGVTHVALRQLLGSAIGLPPAAVPIERAPCARGGGPHGKPRLAGPPPVHFNISHCADLALVAITTIGEVGVDVERESDAAGLAESAGLLGQSHDRPVDERDLLRLWTRKEAVLKATGDGLTVDPLTVSIAVAPELGGWRPATVEGPGAWWVADLALGPAHVGAVACTTATATIAREAWEPP